MSGAGDMRIFASGLDHPEGIAVGRDRTVYCGGEEGQVYRITDAGSRVEQIGSTGGYCLGLALDGRGDLYICDCKLNAVMRMTAAGHCEMFAAEAEGRLLYQPNFAVFDGAGRLYVSCSGDWDKTNAFVARIDAAGKAKVFHAGPLSFANGLALAPDEKSLYIVESTLDRVVRVEIRGDGSAGESHVVAADLKHVPDGLAFDATGNLLVTCYASDTLYRIAPAGAAEVLCADRQAFYLNRPTNIAFMGDELLIPNLGANHVTAVRYGIAGQPLFFPA